LHLPIPIVLVVSRQQHNGGRSRIAAQPAGSFHPVDTGEVHVHQDEVRAQGSGRDDRFLARPCAAHQDEAFRLFHDGTHHALEHFLVVDDEHPDRIHRRSPPSAIIGVVSAPEQGAGLTT